jgi:hypothetical protein
MEYQIARARVAKQDLGPTLTEYPRAIVTRAVGFLEQLLRCQYLYVCTSKASKLSTSSHHRSTCLPESESESESGLSMLSPLPDDAPAAAHADCTMVPPEALFIVDQTEAELGDSGPIDPLFACIEARESGLEVLRRRSASASVSPVRREVRKLELYLAYVSIRQHTSAHVSIRQHTSACVS